MIDTATIEPGRDPVDDLDVIEGELARYGGLEDRPRLVALNKIDVPDGREIADIVVEDLARARPAGLPGVRRLRRGAARADVRDGRASSTRPAGPQPVREAQRIVLRPAVGRRLRRLHRRPATGDGWRVRGNKPERWVRQTDFSNDEAVGFLADRLNRLGVEARLARAGRPGGRRGPHRRTRQRRRLRLQARRRRRRRDAGPPRRGPALRRVAAGRPPPPRDRRGHAGPRPRARPGPTWPAGSTERRRRPAASYEIGTRGGPRPGRGRPAGRQDDDPQRSWTARPPDRGQGRLVVADQPRPAASTPSGCATWSTCSPRRALAVPRWCWSPPGPSPPAWRRWASPVGRATSPAQQAAASVGQGLLVHRYTEEFARHGIVAGQVLLTVDDVTRRSHYRNAYQTFAKLLELGRGADRERERHRRHHRDPLRRQRPAGGAGRPPGARGPAGAAQRRRRSLRRQSRPTGATLVRRRRLGGRPRRRPGRPAGSVRRRHRRHADQARGGPDRDRRRDPGRADLGRRRRTRPSRASRSARSSTPPGGGAPPGCCGWRTPPSRRARCSLDARRRPRRGRAPGLAAGRRHHRGRPGSFVAGDPVDLVGPDGVAVARGLVNFDADEIAHRCSAGPPGS